MSMSVSVGMFISSPSMPNSQFEDRTFVFALRRPEVASCKWMKIPVYPLDRKLPTLTSDDLSRALTEFGQQALVTSFAVLGHLGRSRIGKQTATSLRVSG